MRDLIKNLKEISDKCDSYGDCWEKSECPMHLNDEYNNLHTRCAFRLFVYKLSECTPNRWPYCLERIDEILDKRK